MQHSMVGDADLFVPVFPAVYGGYMVGFGAIFTIADLQDADAGFATTLAGQFVHGAQLGWMSLGGTQDDPPMGLYDLLMDRAYDAEVEWVRQLALMRARVAEWVTHGRLMRTPPIVSQSSQPSQPTRASTLPRCGAPSLSGQFGRPTVECASRGSLDEAPVYLATSWYLAANATAPASLLVLVASPSSKTATRLLLSLDVTDFGFPASAAEQQFTLTALSWDGGDEQLGRFPGGSVQWQADIEGRYVVALLVQAAASNSSSHRTAHARAD